MKKRTLILVAFFCAISGICNICRAQNGMPNPSVVYCESLGYPVSTIIEIDGSERSVCLLPNNTFVDTWDFYRGKVSVEYSYCALKGYNTISKKTEEGTYDIECAYCQSDDNAIQYMEDGKVVNKTEIPMLELMIKNGDIELESDLQDYEDVLSEYLSEENDAELSIELRDNLPESFDLRDCEGHSYIGQIQNQGSCGSCYAFGAAATAEGVYNYATGAYGVNRKSFSESYIAWCLGGVPEYNSHFYGCNGSDNERKEVECMTQYGIIERFNFPYQTYAPSTCAHEDDSRAIFSGWGRIDCGNIHGIKNAIMTYGVVFATVFVNNSFRDYIGDVYSDNNTVCNANPCYYGSNHAVALIGWGRDPIKGEYWILRNSWGTGWGENGYMRIAMSSARVACGATYLIPNPVVYEADLIQENVKIKNGKNVVFKGHEMVNLLDGFEVNEGAEFYAYISSNRGHNQDENDEINKSHGMILSSYDEEKSLIKEGEKLCIEQTGIQIYPNPTSGGITVVHSSSHTIKQVRIINSLGQTINVCRNPNNPLYIPTNNIPRGIYVLQIYTEDQIISRKIVINSML